MRDGRGTDPERSGLKRNRACRGRETVNRIYSMRNSLLSIGGRSVRSEVRGRCVLTLVSKGCWQGSWTNVLTFSPEQAWLGIYIT